jgi:hypothetical protein
MFNLLKYEEKEREREREREKVKRVYEGLCIRYGGNFSTLKVPR